MYTDTEVCNMALAMIGEGHMIESIDEHSVTAEACKRFFNLCLDCCNSTYNWSFARRDEVIDSSFLLSDVVALPYRNAYRLPEDVFKIIRIGEISDTSESETLGRRSTVLFNFRNYDNKRILVADIDAPFAIQYQCRITDVSICDPLFIEALSYLLAHKLCGCIIRDANAANLGTYMYNMFRTTVGKAAALDAQQGNRGVAEKAYSGFLRARQ